MSTLKPKAFPGPSRHASIVCAVPFSSRSKMPTTQPSSTSRIAVARPIPLAPPVSTTRFPFKPRILSALAQRASNREAVQLHGLAGDDELLDLRSALEDTEQPNIPVESFHWIFRHVAGAAKNLDRAIGKAPDHFGGEQLAASCPQCDVLAAIALAGCFQHHRPGSDGVRLAIRNHCLHQLEVCNRLPELLALGGIVYGLPDKALGDAGA